LGPPLEAVHPNTPDGEGHVKTSKESLGRFTGIDLHCRLCADFLCLCVQHREPFDGSAGAMTFDLILMRPIGLAASIVGAAVFIVSLPFSALGGNHEAAAEKLINEPLFFTFQRPLGQLHW